MLVSSHNNKGGIKNTI